jgi:hypothetical protein
MAIAPNWAIGTISAHLNCVNRHWPRACVVDSSSLVVFAQTASRRTSAAVRGGLARSSWPLAVRFSLRFSSSVAVRNACARRATSDEFSWRCADEAIAVDASDNVVSDVATSLLFIEPVTRQITVRLSNDDAYASFSRVAWRRKLAGTQHLYDGGLLSIDDLKSVVRGIRSCASAPTSQIRACWLCLLQSRSGRAANCSLARSASCGSRSAVSRPAARRLPTPLATRTRRLRFSTQRDASRMSSLHQTL